MLLMWQTRPLKYLKIKQAAMCEGVQGRLVDCQKKDKKSRDTKRETWRDIRTPINLAEMKNGWQHAGLFATDARAKRLDFSRRRRRAHLIHE